MSSFKRDFCPSALIENPIIIGGVQILIVRLKGVRLSEPEEQVTEIVQDTDLAEQTFEETNSEHRAPRWIAPAWFLFGVIVGAVAFAFYTMATVKPAAPAIDTTAMRGAARDGVLEAIATLQAGGGQQQPAAESQEPTVVDASKFTLRPANTISNPGAKVISLYVYQEETRWTFHRRGPKLSRF